MFKSIPRAVRFSHGVTSWSNHVFDCIFSRIRRQSVDVANEVDEDDDGSMSSFNFDSSAVLITSVRHFRRVASCEGTNMRGCLRRMLFKPSFIAASGIIIYG